MFPWVLFSPGLSVKVGRDTRSLWRKAKDLVTGMVVAMVVDNM